MIIERLNLEKTPDPLAKNVDKLLQVTEADYEKVLKYLDVTPEQCHEAVQKVQEWYSKQPHLPQGALHDQFALRQLIVKSMDLDKVKEAIDNFYTVKSKFEFLKNKDPLLPHLDAYMKNGHWLILPKKTKDMCRVTIFRTIDSSDLNASDLLKVLTMMIDYRYHNDMMIGEEIIFYMKHNKISNATQFTPSFITNFMFYLMSCTKSKVKGVYYVNLPPYSEAAMKLIKKCLNTKILNRMHMCATIEEVAEKIGKDIFPCDLGGTAGPSNEIAQSWTETLQSPGLRDWFIQQEGMVTDESKREKPLQDDTTFGVEGSFKKIELD